VAIDELPSLEDLMAQDARPKRRGRPSKSEANSRGLDSLPSLDDLTSGTKKGRKPQQRKGKVSVKDVRQGVTIAISLTDSILLGNVLGWQHTTDDDKRTGAHFPVPGLNGQTLWWHIDRLTPEEQSMLGEAITDEVMMHEKLKAWAAKLREITPHGKILMALAYIATPRLARRGIIPMELASAFVGGQVPTGAQNEVDNTVPLEGRPAPVNSGWNGDGKVDASELPLNTA